MECRLVKKGNSAVTQIRVQWLTLPDTLATWEDYYVLKQIHRSGDVLVLRGDSVMRVVKQCNRKGFACWAFEPVIDGPWPILGSL
jgi:hypothetical protein